MRPLAVLALVGAVGCASMRAPGLYAEPTLRLDEAQIDEQLAGLRRGSGAAAWTLGAARASRPDVHAALRAVLDDPATDDELRGAALWALYRAGDPLRGEWLTAATPAPSEAPAYDTPPKLVHKTAPGYPRDAFQTKVEGTVVASILIDASGRVARLHLTQSIPPLDRAAVRCLAAWRFSPAVKDGRPVATAASVPINFRIF